MIYFFCVLSVAFFPPLLSPAKWRTIGTVSPVFAPEHKDLNVQKALNDLSLVPPGEVFCPSFSLHAFRVKRV